MRSLGELRMRVLLLKRLTLLCESKGGCLPRWQPEESVRITSAGNTSAAQHVKVNYNSSSAASSGSHAGT